MKRLGTAALIAAAIYGSALGLGTLLFATGAIGTGATHNTCDDFRHQIAQQRGISEQDVPQGAVRAATEKCLEGHRLTAREAFRSEYLFWSLWPAVICAVIYLLWPAWAAALHRQEMADAVREASRLEPGDLE